VGSGWIHRYASGTQTIIPPIPLRTALLLLHDPGYFEKVSKDISSIQLMIASESAT
jgi:hypothetical protein